MADPPGAAPAIKVGSLHRPRTHYGSRLVPARPNWLATARRTLWSGSEPVARTWAAVASSPRRDMPVLPGVRALSADLQRVWGSDPHFKLTAARGRPPSDSVRRRSSSTRRFDGSAATPRVSSEQVAWLEEHSDVMVVENMYLVSRRPVLRIRPAVDRADAPPRWPPGRGGLDLRPVL